MLLSDINVSGIACIEKTLPKAAIIEVVGLPATLNGHQRCSDMSNYGLNQRNPREVVSMVFLFGAMEQILDELDTSPPVDTSRTASLVVRNCYPCQYNKHFNLRWI